MLSYLFGQYLLECGLISTEQLTDGLRYQRNNNRVMGELAVEMGLLDRQQILQILEWQLSVDKDFGQVAKELGFLSEEQLEHLLELQQERHVYLGEALVTQGILKRAELENALKNFHGEKEKSLKAGAEEEPEKDTAAALFSLVSKMLPRLSSGKMVSGGLYPTISDPHHSYIFCQRLCGEQDLAACLTIPEDLFEVFGEALSSRIKQAVNGGKSAKYGRAIKGCLRNVLEVFAANQKKEGFIYRLEGETEKFSRRIYLSRKKKAHKSSCAEFFLITPPGPDGEFLQFNLCLLFSH
ncbi:MAG: hypothetical protein A2Z86_06190 [Candidatus Glassbacteria bacterium GWA2_58_10]|uniref:Type II secretion system protein GspE N-terminal domain-containing protein n=1 Tax=Candidatus Glassbacteria bacterium GWA2_58_10 TaxID=1817865 RepID=A0A1F5YAJ4_9BACT|nr:MAG: hypothetical protein A2Z86_06190 [Candidatus Glassbacteria bacterium GWA2_58_10]